MSPPAKLHRTRILQSLFLKGLSLNLSPSEAARAALVALDIEGIYPPGHSPTIHPALLLREHFSDMLLSEAKVFITLLSPPVSNYGPLTLTRLKETRQHLEGSRFALSSSSITIPLTTEEEQ